ncbi:MAG: hypothetical protein ACRC1K_12145, partial [Planctomycetia bacterium]
ETLRPVVDLLPVVLRDVPISTDVGGGREAWPLALTADGVAGPLLRLDDDPAASQLRWKEFPGFFASFPTGGVKPAASVHATFSDPRTIGSTGAPPAVAVQFFGAGRVLYLGSSETWRLRQLGDRLYDRLWIQWVRYLGEGRLLRGAGRGSFVLDGDRFPFGAPLNLAVRLLDEEYRPSTDAEVELTVVDPTGASHVAALKPMVGRPGSFAAPFLPPTVGEYRLQLLVPGGSEVLERTIQVTAPDLEFADVRRQIARLERLATGTKGLVVGPDEVDRLPALFADRGERQTLPGVPMALWDRAWVMIAAAALLSVEWAVRKAWNLA